MSSLLGPVENRYFAETMRANDPFNKCHECKKEIKPGQMYYRVELLPSRQWVEMHGKCLFGW